MWSDDWVKLTLTFFFHLNNSPSKTWQKVEQTRGEFGRHFGRIFELGKYDIKCSVVR